MSLNLDALIQTTEDSIDMKAGLDSLQGISDATRCIAEGVLTGKAPKRQNHKGKVRTSLKKSFKGSYGQIFSLEIYDDELKKKFNRIGKATFSELISYFIHEALYQEHQRISDKAHKIIEDLADTAEAITKQLRKSALENIHEIPKKFNYDLKLRYRKSRTDQTTIAKFDRQTARALEAKEIDEQIDLEVSITRLNINTGNGRLLVKGARDTVAFGFGIQYREVALKAKKIFSENLDYNNGINSKNWRHLKISAKPIKLKDGTIIKFIVKGFYDA